MPYLNDELLKNKDEESTQAAPGVQTIGNGATAEQAAATAKKGGGQFANLDEYLRVNEPQALGQQLAGKVGSDIKSANDTVDSAGSQFKSRVDQSTVKDNPDLVSKATSDPTSFANDQTNVDQWDKLFNAQYSGPSDFSEASDLARSSYGAAQTAKGKADASKSEEGRFALLDNYFGKPTYSSGQKSLDNLLVQNDPNANQAFDQIQKNAQAVAQKQQTQAKDLSDYAARGKGTTEAARQDARNALGVTDAGNLTGNGAYQNYQKDINDRVTKYSTDQGTHLKAIQEAAKAAKTSNNVGSLEKYGAGKVAPQFPATAKVTPANFPDLDGSYLLGVDPTDSKYFSTEQAPTAESVVSQGDIERLKALNRLAGMDVLSVPSQVGSYDPTKDVAFRSDLLDTDRKQKAGDFQTDLDKALGEFTKASQPGAPVQDINEYIDKVYDYYGLPRPPQYHMSLTPPPADVSVGNPDQPAPIVAPDGIHMTLPPGSSYRGDGIDFTGGKANVPTPPVAKPAPAPVPAPAPAPEPSGMNPATGNTIPNYAPVGGNTTVIPGAYKPPAGGYVPGGPAGGYKASIPQQGQPANAAQIASNGELMKNLLKIFG